MYFVLSSYLSLTIGYAEAPAMWAGCLFHDCLSLDEMMRLDQSAKDRSKSLKRKYEDSNVASRKASIRRDVLDIQSFVSPLRAVPNGVAFALPAQ